MEHELTVVDTSSPPAIAQAIKKVNQTAGLRIGPGIEALWAIFKAPQHTLRRVELEEQFGALDLHFGWFCRRVAEELGASNATAFALVDQTRDDQGDQILTLKPSVTAAMQLGKRAGPPRD